MVRGAARQRLPHTGPASRCEGRRGGGVGGREGAVAAAGGSGQARRRLPLTAGSAPESCRPRGEAVPQAGAQVRRSGGAAGGAGLCPAAPPVGMLRRRGGLTAAFGAFRNRAQVRRCVPGPGWGSAALRLPRPRARSRARRWLCRSWRREMRCDTFCA